MENNSVGFFLLIMLVLSAVFSMVQTFSLSFCSESQHELLVRRHYSSPQQVMSLRLQFPVDPVTFDLEMIRVKLWMPVSSCTMIK